MSQKTPLYEIFIAYASLAFTTFGGPQAHIALFHELFVEKLKWIQNSSFIELFAIAQSLPGPASTQLAYSIAFVHAGLTGAILSFLLWSVPMMIIMMGLGVGLNYIGIAYIPMWAKCIENGLVSAAVGLVALAAYKLGNKIIIDFTDIVLALFSLCMSINLVAEAWLFPALMIFGGSTSFITWKVSEYFKNKVNNNNAEEYQALQEDEDALEVQGLDQTVEESISIGFQPETGLYILSFWAFLLVIAVLLKLYCQILLVQILSTFYFIGSLIFGGGPVVIPLLQQYLISNGWLTTQEFLLGLAFINVLPGPMFNFSAFCGVLATRSIIYGIPGGILAYLGIFAPGLILMTGLMPLWMKFRNLKSIKIIFKGINASAVGLVFAAIYLLGQKSIIEKPQGSNIAEYPLYLAIASISFTLAGFTKLPTPLIIFLGGVLGYLIG